MKITTLILLMALMQVSAASVAQRITFVKKNASLEQVFQEITRQTGYEVFYGDKKFDDSRKINVAFKDATLDEVLKTCLQYQRASYVIEEKSIIIKPAAEPTFLGRLADRWAAIDVHGRVVDQEGKPLPGATVKVKTTGKSVSTNGKGEFYLERVDEDALLIISYIGYKVREIKAAPNLAVVSLELSIADLDEVKINRGYYTTTKEFNTGNVASVKAADIEKQNVNNPILALQGRVPGVEINQVSGIADGQIKINIRGINTLEQQTDPLYIVDGVPYVSNLNAQSLVSIGGGGVNPLSLISPSQIESIDVLKDADATAIYGSRGANGVILITTKKGYSGNTTINLNVQSGVGEVTRKVKLLNTQQYISMRKEAFENDKLSPTIISAPDLMVYDQNRYTDWQEELIGSTAKYRNAQVTVSGGNLNTQFLIGANYHLENTVFPDKDPNEKTSLNFNISSSGFNKRLQIILSGSFLSDRNQLPNTDYTRFITLAPNAPSLYNSDGSINWTTYRTNIYADKLIRYKGNSSNLIGNGTINYRLLTGLQAKISLGYNGIWLDETKTSPIAVNSPSSGILTGASIFTHNFLNSWVAEPQLNYQKRIANGDLNLIFGGTVQQRASEGQTIIGLGYTDDVLLESLAGAPEIIKGDSSFERYKYASLFARISYNWQQKYLLNLTGRRDGSSRFGPGKQYGNFGAVGTGWIFSKEDFFTDFSPFFSFGKIRGSYGTSGSEPGTNYAFLELYRFTTIPAYGGGSGLEPNNLFAPNYRWEVNKKLEIGLEMGMIDNRLNLTASYYRNRSSNQLIAQTLPYSTGFLSVTANLPATIQNLGWEFMINSINWNNKSFQWTSNLNLTTAKNKLMSFPNLNISDYRNLYTIGQPINSLRLYHYAGIDATSGRYQFYDVSGKVTLTPSSETDRTQIVNITPKYYGGFQNAFTFKGISLDLLFQFVKQKGQNYLLSNSVSPGRFASNINSNQPVELLDRNRFQRISTTSASLSSNNLAKSSDFAYTDASYIRLKTLSLSYQLPSNWLNKLRIQDFKFSIQGQNLLTFTNYEGSDPETQSMFNLPPLRVITAGIQLTL